MRPLRVLLAALVVLPGPAAAVPFDKDKHCGGKDYSDAAYDSDYFGQPQSGCFWEGLRKQRVDEKVWADKETDRCFVVYMYKYKSDDACTTYATLKEMTDPAKTQTAGATTKEMAETLKQNIEWAEEQAAKIKDVFRPDSTYMQEIDGRLGLMRRQQKAIQAETDADKAREKMKQMNESGPLKSDFMAEQKLHAAGSEAEKKAALDDLFGERTGSGVPKGAGGGPKPVLAGGKLAGGAMHDSGASSAESLYGKLDYVPPPLTHSVIPEEKKPEPDRTWDKQLRQPVIDRLEQNPIGAKTAAPFLKDHPDVVIQIEPKGGDWASYNSEDKAMRINQPELNREIRQENEDRAKRNVEAKKLGQPQEPLLDPVDLKKPLTKDQTTFIADRYMTTFVHEIGGHAVDDERAKDLPRGVTRPANRDTEYIAFGLQSEAYLAEKEKAAKEGRQLTCGTSLCLDDKMTAETWQKNKDNPEQFKKSIDNMGYAREPATHESKEEKVALYRKESSQLKQYCAPRTYDKDKCNESLNTAMNLLEPGKASELARTSKDNPRAFLPRVANELNRNANRTDQGDYAADFYNDKKNREKLTKLYDDRFDQVLKGKATDQ